MVPADAGLPGRVDQPVHRAAHAQDPARPEDLQGDDAGAVDPGLQAQGAGLPAHESGSSAGPGQRLAGGRGLEGARAGAHRRRDDRRAQGRGAQDRLPGGALGHRADLPGRAARRQPDRARDHVGAGQADLPGRRPEPDDGGQPAGHVQSQLPRQPVRARGQPLVDRAAVHAHRRGGAGPALRRRAEEIHRRVLRDRHAQAVRERHRHPRPPRWLVDEGDRQGQRAGHLPRRHALPEQLRGRRLGHEAQAALAAVAARHAAGRQGQRHHDADGGRRVLRPRVHRAARHQRRELRQRRQGPGRHRRAQGRPGGPARAAPGLGRERQRPQDAAQRRPVLQLQAARRQRPGARVQQLHAAAGAGGPPGLPARRARHAGRQLPLPARAGGQQGQHGKLAGAAPRAGRSGAAAARGAAVRAGRQPARQAGDAGAARGHGAAHADPVRRRRRPEGRCARAGRGAGRSAGAVAVHRARGARARARPRVRGAAAHPQRQPVRAAQAGRGATGPTQADARRRDAGLHDAGGAVAVGCDVLSRAGPDAAGRLPAGPGQRVPGDPRPWTDPGLSGRRVADRRCVCDALRQGAAAVAVAGGRAGTQRTDPGPHGPVQQPRFARPARRIPSAQAAAAA